MQIVVNPGSPHTAFTVPVPGLTHGESRARQVAFPFRWGNSWEYGAYSTKTCADVDHVIAETNEHDNCDPMHRVYVVPVGFHGRITGSAVKIGNPNLTLSWTADDVHFQWQRNASQPGAPNDGILDYHFKNTQPNAPEVHYAVSGTDFSGCTWQGTGTYELRRSDYVRATFAGRFSDLFTQSQVDTLYHFPATVTCGSQTSTVDVTPSEWGQAFRWLDMSPGSPFPARGVTNVVGSHTDQNATWTWDLRATDELAL